MRAFLTRRLLLLIPTLLGVTLATFLMLHLTPGDPVTIMLGEFASASDVARLRAELGLDRPILVQYFKFLGRAVRGDLGSSIRSRRPVQEEIAERLPPTMVLALAAQVLAVCAGITAGVTAAAARRPAGGAERGLRAAGGVPPCAGKRVEPRPRGRRAAVRGTGRRRRDRRVRLLAPGVGPAGGYRDSVTGFPTGPGDCARRRLHVCLPERGRRSRVRSPRSPHPLPVMTTISRTPPRVAALPAAQTSRTILRRLRRRPLVVAAFAVLALFVILAVAAPLLAPHD